MKKKKRFVTIDIIFGESFSLYFKNIIQITIPVFIAFSLFGVFFYQYMNFITDLSPENMTTSGLYTYVGIVTLASLVFYMENI